MLGVLILLQQGVIMNIPLICGREPTSVAAGHRKESPVGYLSTGVSEQELAGMQARNEARDAAIEKMGVLDRRRYQEASVRPPFMEGERLPAPPR